MITQTAIGAPLLAYLESIQPGSAAGQIGLTTPYGRIFYVDSTAAYCANNRSAGTRDHPFATLQWALANVASAKDIFLLCPGHSESIALTTVACAAAAVNIIGLGRDTYQPKLTFTTSTSATLTMSGAGCGISNVRFEVGVDSLVALLTLTGAGCAVDGCLFIEGSAMQALTSISIGANAHRAVVTNNEIISATAGAQDGIKIGGTADRVKIKGNFIYGNFSNAPIYSNQVHTLCWVRDNDIVQLNTTVPIRFTAAATGLVARNGAGLATALANRTGNAGLDIGSCYAVENYVSDSEADTSGLLSPVANTH